MVKKIITVFALIALLISILSGCKPEEATIKSMEIKTLPGKVVFTEDEPGELDISSLEVLLLMSNGTTVIENVKQKNEEQEGTYTITQEIDYDKAGEYYVAVMRKDTENYCSFKIVIEEATREYSNELNINDCWYNYWYNSLVCKFIKNNLYFTNYHDQVYVFDLETKKVSSFNITLDAAYQDYSLFDYFPGGKYNFITIYKEDPVDEDDYIYKYLILDQEMNFVKETKFEYNGIKFYAFRELAYNNETYFNAYIKGRAGYLFKFNEDNLKMELVIKEAAEFIIKDNIIYYKDNCFYRYNMKTGRVNLITDNLPDYYSFQVKGDYMYIEKGTGLYKISYDGKDSIEFKTINDLTPFFTSNEIYYLPTGEYLDEIEFFYYNQETDEFIDLLSKNKNLEGVINLITNGNKNYIQFGAEFENDCTKLLEFKDVNDLLNYDGDLSKLIKLEKD